MWTFDDKVANVKQTTMNTRDSVNTAAKVNGFSVVLCVPLCMCVTVSVYVCDCVCVRATVWWIFLWMSR